MSGSAKKTKKKDAHAQTIACLAERGPLNMYQIQKQTDLYYSSVHEAVNTLNLENDVCEIEKIMSQKNKRITLFGLTFKGFVIYLSNHAYFTEVHLHYSWEEETPKIQEIQKNYRKESNALSEEITKLLGIIESNGRLLDYAIFKEIKWLAERHIPVIWEILETASLICVHPPFTLNAVALIEQTEGEIKRLEREKARLNNPIMRRAFLEDQPDNPFELNDKKLGYARQNLKNLLQLEDELWRRDYAKYFAFRSQSLLGIKNMRNEELAVFFKQVAESGRSEVEPAEKMANLFSGS